MKNQIQIKKWFMGRTGVLMLIGLAWCATVLWGVVPTWKTILGNDKEIGMVQDRVASLGELSAMGGWIEEANNRLEPTLNQRYEEWFPTDKELSRLYYDLAQVASRSGVDGFDLREIENRDYDVPVPEWKNTETEIGAQMERLLGQLGATAENFPSSDLKPYRLRATFDTSYSRLAKLLDELPTIDRALTVSSLNVSQSQDGVSVKLEMDYYVQE